MVPSRAVGTHPFNLVAATKPTPVVRTNLSHARTRARARATRRSVLTPSRLARIHLLPGAPLPHQAIAQVAAHRTAAAVVVARTAVEVAAVLTAEAAVTAAATTNSVFKSARVARIKSGPLFFVSFSLPTRLATLFVTPGSNIESPLSGISSFDIRNLRDRSVGATSRYSGITASESSTRPQFAIRGAPHPVARLFQERNRYVHQ
jgi:hypothetical protein